MLEFRVELEHQTFVFTKISLTYFSGFVLLLLIEKNIRLLATAWGEKKGCKHGCPVELENTLPCADSCFKWLDSHLAHNTLQAGG